MKKVLKMFLIVFVCVLTMSLSACGGNNEKYYDMAVDHLKSHLKDPESIKVKDVTGYKDEENVAFEMLYDAKNSFGGYNGYEVIHVVISLSDNSVNCDNCEALDYFCSSMYSILKTTGEQIYGD